MMSDTSWRSISIDPPLKNVKVIVAWIGQFGEQITFIAQLYHEIWFAHGTQIATPTHWMPIPTLENAQG